MPAQCLATLLLCVAVSTSRIRHPRAIWVLVLAAWGVSVLSHGAVLLGLCLVHAWPFAGRRTSWRAAVVPIVIYDLVIGCWYFFELRGQRSVGLQDFWAEHFLSLESIASVGQFLFHAAVGFPGQAFALGTMVYAASPARSVPR